MVERGGDKAKKLKNITIGKRNCIYEKTPSEGSYNFFHRHPVTGKLPERADGDK